jgi:hypothetical protein
MAKGHRRWLAEVERLRSDRPGLASQLREPKWRPDFWEPIPSPGEDRRAYEAWTKYNDRRAETYFFLCKGSHPSKRHLRRLRRMERAPGGQ